MKRYFEVKEKGGEEDRYIIPFTAVLSVTVYKDIEPTPDGNLGTSKIKIYTNEGMGDTDFDLEYPDADPQLERYLSWLEEDK